MRNFIFFIFLVFLISGCETLGAFRSGDIKTKDIVYMLKAGLVSEESLQSMEGKEPSFLTAVQKADAWMRDNLW